MPSSQDLELGSFFDECASQGLMDGFEPGELPTLERFFAGWAIRPGDRVLEPGCGAGRLTERLAEAVGPAGRVFACDLSAGMLACARRRGLPPQVTLVHGTVTELEAPGQGFDHILCMNVFPHFLEPEAVLRHFARLLKPGGALWVNHFESSARLNDFHRQAGRSVERHTLLPAARMHELFSPAGLTVVLAEEADDIYRVMAIPADRGEPNQVL